MKKLFGFTPINDERDNLSDSSEPQTQRQNVQRAELHITPIPTPTAPPLLPTPPHGHKPRGHSKAEEQCPGQRPEFLSPDSYNIRSRIRHALLSCLIV